MSNRGELAEFLGICAVLFVCWRVFVFFRDKGRRLEEEEQQAKHRKQYEERLKREEEERLKREEEERLKREEEERLKREEEERLKREEEERLKREEEERLKREEERLKREEEERLKREEEERLKREEEERQRLEFENSPRGRLQKAITISREYELFVFIAEMLNRPYITESEAISKADRDESIIKAAGIKSSSKVISFTFEGFHFSIVLGEMSSGFMPDDSGRYGDCYLLVDSELVLETRASSDSGPEWYDVTKYAVKSEPDSVRLLKLDEWLEQIPLFRKAHQKAKFDEATARALEKERKENEALNKNVSLGKFDQRK